MSYILPRAFIVLIGWAITCGLIDTVGFKVDLLIGCFAAMSWALAGIVCFGYLHKWRREAQASAQPMLDRSSRSNV
jgi:hypothetical protein